MREENSVRRDALAGARDAAAEARDRLAAEIDAEIDAEIEALDSHALAHLNGGATNELLRLRRLVDERRRAQLSRARAATQRQAAALDRRQAAKDRERAADALRQAESELVLEGIDHLTGMLRRRAGTVALQREIDRTDRAGEPLVIVFVDLEGLGALNDTDGHAAGDVFLRQVAESIHESMRAYDVVVRWGGDGFVCSLAGQEEAGVRQRFEQIAGRVTEASGGRKITFGLARSRPKESLDDLIVRADETMIGMRRRSSPRR